MKKWISLFMILAILCSLAACTAPALQDGSEAPADSKESPEADLTVCPHYVEQKYLDMATSLPAIIFSTTGEENGLVNNIYLFRGQVLDATTLADIPTITVATEYGNVSIYNLYYYIYQNCVEEMGHETADFIFEHGNDYIFPEVGATAIFTAVYQGYAEVLDMPSFILGVNDFLLGITDDTSSETQPSEAQPPETLPPDTQPTEAQSPATQPPATQPPATQPPATQPPETQPPATQPPTTQPPETQPPVTEPPATEPPVTEPPATSTGITFISFPQTIGRNETATVTIQGAPNTSYSITVRYKSGPSKADGLETKTSDSNGIVSWSWQIGGKTSYGTFTITVSGGGQSKTVNFTIVE